MAAAVSVGGAFYTAPSAKAQVIVGGDVVSPLQTGVQTTKLSFDIGSFGSANCYAYAKAKSGYTVGLTVVLQQYDGGWNSYKTWNVSAASIAELDKTYAVASGYTYRLKVTFKSYEDGTLVDSNTKYSAEKSY